MRVITSTVGEGRRAPDTSRPANRSVGRVRRATTCLPRSAVWIVAAVSLLARPGGADPRPIEVGLALAIPALGLSIRTPVGERFEAGLVVGAGVQAQINWDGKVRDGSYGFFGVGSDRAVSLVRGGYGYEWRLKALSIHAEIGLGLPFRAADDLGLALVGYAIPFAFGAHYAF